MSKAWMPMYWGDYFANTRDLTTIQHGAYLMLIGHYWEHKGLPTDDKQLAVIVGMAPSAWKAIKGPIEAKFLDGWRHGRIEDELTTAAKKQAQREMAGKKGGMASVLSRSILQGQITSIAQAEVKRSVKRISSGRLSEIEANGVTMVNGSATNHISKKDSFLTESSSELEEAVRKKGWTPQ